MPGFISESCSVHAESIDAGIGEDFAPEAREVAVHGTQKTRIRG
jgi:hypothetical protein